MNKKIAVFGHRKIDKEDRNYLENSTLSTFEQFIFKGDKTFLFGSNSEFNDLCYNTIINLQSKYSDIRYAYISSNALSP